MITIVFIVLVISRFSSAVPVALFDAANPNGLVMNENSEIEEWVDVKFRSWGMSSLSHNQPHLIEDGFHRPHVKFSGKQRLVLNISTPVYIDSSGGSTLSFVLRNEYTGQHNIFGGAGNAVNAHLRFDNPTSLRIHPPGLVFRIRDSTDRFHAYVIRSSNNMIEVYQDGDLIGRQPAYGNKLDTAMRCLGCWFSKWYLRGSLSYLVFHDYAIEEKEMRLVQYLLHQVSRESNDGLINDTAPHTAPPKEVSPPSSIATPPVDEVSPPSSIATPPDEVSPSASIDMGQISSSTTSPDSDDSGLLLFFRYVIGPCAIALFVHHMRKWKEKRRALSASADEKSPELEVFSLNRDSVHAHSVMAVVDGDDDNGGNDGDRLL